MLTHTELYAGLAVLIVLIVVVLLFYILKGKSKGGGSSSSSNEQVYVGNLPYRANQYDLRNIFSDYGTIRHVKVVKDPNTGRSRGYAFVTFENCQQAKKALAAHGKDLHGRTMVVRIAKPRGEEERGPRGE